MEQKYGKILNLSSVSALGNRGQANYSAAKMGIQGLTRTLGIELGPFGVTANAIAPGFIATEMTDATARRLKMEPEELQRLNAEATPVRRVGQPEDIAAAAAFLCSDEASFITGQATEFRKTALHYSWPTTTAQHSAGPWNRGKSQDARQPKWEDEV